MGSPPPVLILLMVLPPGPMTPPGLPLPEWPVRLPKGEHRELVPQEAWVPARVQAVGADRAQRPFAHSKGHPSP